MTTEIIISKGCSIPKSPIVIEGFPSKGFVSTIAAKYIIDEMQMEPIGYITSDKLRSVAVIHDSKPMRPIRIYAKDNIIVILSELIIPINHVPEFSNAIIKWLREIDPQKVILLAGISGKDTEKEHEIFGISNLPEITERLAHLNVNGVEEGMLTGISSDLLLYCIENDIPSISLMAETKNLPDPLASASMLRILDQILDLGVDCRRLIEEGKRIEEMFKEVGEQMKRGKDGYKQMEDFSHMYG